MNYSVHPMGEACAKGAAWALARAFMDDPLFVFIAPDAEERRRWMPVVMREVMRCGGPDRRHRVVVAEDGEVAGAMVAGSYPPPLGVSLRQQLITLMLPRPWVPNLRHVIRVFRYLDDWQARHYKGAHHYVYALGVAPEHQHRGLGRRMMTALLEEAGQEGTPVYLETVTEANVRFYTSLGFRETERCRSHAEGPTTWMMLWSPEADFRRGRP